MRDREWAINGISVSETAISLALNHLSCWVPQENRKPSKPHWDVLFAPSQLLFTGCLLSQAWEASCGPSSGEGRVIF